MIIPLPTLGGTELTAIWPSDLVGLYTILSVEQASVQDFAGSTPATRGLIAAPWTSASLIPVAVFQGTGNPPFFQSRPAAESRIP